MSLERSWFGKYLPFIVTMAIAALVLVGWILDIGFLKTIFPGLTPMNPMTAVCLFSMSVGCILLVPALPSPARRVCATALGLFVLSIGAIMSCKYLFGYDVGVDRLLFVSKLGINRMAIITALNIALSGLALIIFDVKYKRTRFSHILIMIMLTTSTYALCAYIYNSVGVYGRTVFNPVAVHTAIAFIFFGAGAMKLRNDGFWDRLQQVKRWYQDLSLTYKLLMACFMLVSTTLVFSVLMYTNLQSVHATNSEALSQVSQLRTVVNQTLSTEMVGKNPASSKSVSIQSSIDKIQFTTLAETEDTLTFIERLLFTLAFVFTVGGFVISYYIARFLTKSLLTVESGAREIASGNLDNTINVESKDEIGRLAKVFNEMAHRISFTQKTLELKNVEMRTSIEDLESTKQASLNILEDLQESKKIIEEEKNRTEVANKDLEKYKFALDSTSNQVVITDKEGIILYANPALEQITGFSPAEVIGKKVGTSENWGGQMGVDFYQRLWQTIKAEKKPFSAEIVNRRKNGQTYKAATTLSPVSNKDGTVEFFVGIERDVTEQKLQEKKLADSKALDEAMLASIGDGLFAVDKDGRIMMINSAFEKMLGWTAGEVLGKQLTQVVPMLDQKGKLIPEADRIITKTFREHQIIQTTTIQSVSYQRKDGSPLPITLTLSPIKVGNELTGAIAVFRDITKEKEVDRMKTEFISLASHQLRTPLTAVKWFTEMLLDGDNGTLTPEILESVKNISDSNERMIELVNSLLNISRIESGRMIIEPVLTDLAELLHGVLTELTPKVQAKQQNLIVSVHPDLPKISIDPKLVRQVYINFLTNAIKYTPDKGDISIFISSKDNEVVSQISDTGYGIPKKQQDRVFQKFFRAENIVPIETDGNGLGLYLVKAIIEASGGRTWFESEEGKGSSFWFSLPLGGSEKHEGEVHLD